MNHHHHHQELAPNSDASADMDHSDSNDDGSSSTSDDENENEHNNNNNNNNTNFSDDVFRHARTRQRQEGISSQEKSIWKLILETNTCAAGGTTTSATSTSTTATSTINKNGIPQALQMLRHEPRLAARIYRHVDLATISIQILLPLHSLLVLVARSVNATASVSVNDSSHSAATATATATIEELCHAISQVYDLYPKALVISMVYHGFRGLPLEYACTYIGNGHGNHQQTVLDLMQFLATHYPRALRTPNAIGLFPIHRALQSKQHLPVPHWPTVQLFHILMQAAANDANAITNYNDITAPLILMRDQHPFYHMNPLEWSFFMEYDVTVQEYLMDEFLKHHHHQQQQQQQQQATKDMADRIANQTDTTPKDFRLDVSPGDNASFNRQQATLVARLLPHIQSMEVICSKKLCVEGFVQLLTCLADNTANNKVKDLSIWKLSNEYIHYFVPAWVAVETLLATTTILQHLSLSARLHVFGAEVVAIHDNSHPDTVDQHTLAVSDDNTLPGQQPSQPPVSFLHAIVRGLHQNGRNNHRHNNNNSGDESLQSLTLQQMEIPSQRLFCSLLDQRVLLKRLVLEHVTLNFLWNSGNDHNNDSSIQDATTLYRPSLESLTIQTTVTTSASNDCVVPGLLYHLAKLPALKELSLTLTFDNNPHNNDNIDDNDSKSELANEATIDITKPLAAILELNRLERLIIRSGYKSSGTTNSRGGCPTTVDFPSLCTECLATNTSLQLFDCNIVQEVDNNGIRSNDDHQKNEDKLTTPGVLSTLLATLEQHNVTLTRIPVLFWNLHHSTFSDPSSFAAIIEQIDYWLQLNQHGRRAKARDATTTADEFVDLLCQQVKVVTDDDNSNNSNNNKSNVPPGIPGCHDSVKRLDLFNVLYGLLREFPSTWS